MYMAVWGVLPHSNSIFYRIFVNYTSDFRHFPKNRRFASGGGWQNGAFVHFAVEVCRFGRRLDLPSLYPAGGRACFAACYSLPLACFPAPYPPNPLPRRGRGRPKVYFAGGEAPGTPALNRLRHLQSLPLLYPAGAYLLCRLPTPPIASLSAPQPPAPPSPVGKGEPQSLFRRGLRPRHPCTEPLAALTEPSSAVPGGGVPGWLPARPAVAIPSGGRACFAACCPPCL